MIINSAKTLIEALRNERDKLWPKYPAGLLDLAADTIELALNDQGWISEARKEEIPSNVKYLRSKRKNGGITHAD